MLHERPLLRDRLVRVSHAILGVELDGRPRTPAHGHLAAGEELVHTLEGKVGYLGEEVLWTPRVWVSFGARLK